jgi:hypothetical protein
MIRNHGMSTSELGIFLGLIIAIAGMVGALATGYVSSRWILDDKILMRACAGAFALVMPCLLIFLGASEKRTALLALIPVNMILGGFLSPVYALMQRLVPAGMRATMLAVVMLFSNLIGFGLGPQLVGIFSDLLAPSFGVESLRYAMAVMSFVALWGAYHFWQVGVTVRDDLVNVLADSEGRESALAQKI